MHDKSIGSSHTIFYENWADALECAGNYQKADEVYQLGIARNAQPLLRLQRLHELVFPYSENLCQWSINA